MTNINIIMQALILLATLISCIYGIIQIQNGLSKKYFILALYGMIAFLFARIFYLVNVLSKANDSILTIDVLGNGAAYLFFITASTRYLTRSFTNKLKSKINIYSLIGIILLAFILLLTSLKVNSLPSYIRETLYFIFMGNSLYTSIGIITSTKDIKECKYVYSFNVCNSLLILTTALIELTKAYVPNELILLPISVLTLIIIILISLMLPLLKKEVIKWKQ